jgi:aminopeptidase N
MSTPKVDRVVVVSASRAARVIALLMLSLRVAAHPAWAQSPVAQAEREFDVTHYDVRVDPRLQSGTVRGVAVLTVVLARREVGAINLRRGTLEIDSVAEDGHARAFVVEGTSLHIALPPSHRRPRTITVAYHGAPKSGLVFVPEHEQIYTVFSTSQWMPAHDEPDARASLNLRVTIPHAWAAAGSGREVSRRAVSKERDIVEWQQDRPMPTYTFGFAVGRFAVTSARASDVTLRLLADGFAAADAQRVLNESAAMLSFFTERAGVPFPGSVYGQALVMRTAGQEMAGLSIVSEAYGRTLVGDISTLGLLAHEFAHQWWGNMVTCRSWTDFWLNEGMATFMAAAYREQRFGRDAYLSDVAEMRRRYAQVVAHGGDRSLVFPNWDHPSADDRTIVYQKGALVLHELRELLGETAFWSGIRDFTRNHFGQSVTTTDFRAAMERASDRDLGSFFDQWVYARR